MKNVKLIIIVTALIVSICACIMAVHLSSLGNPDVSREPEVQLVEFTWFVWQKNWEFHYMKMNFTLCNNGSEAEIGLAVDALAEGKCIASNTWHFQINATSNLHLNLSLWWSMIFTPRDADEIIFGCYLLKPDGELDLDNSFFKGQSTVEDPEFLGVK